MSLYSSEECVDLTQMPMLPYALEAINRRKKDPALVKEFLPKIVRYYKVISLKLPNSGVVVRLS